MYNKRFANPVFSPAIIAIIIGAGMVAINLFRIINIPITIDETGVRPNDTYFSLMRNKIGSANNHILHSLFRKFFIDTFGNSLFFLRVDSLIAQVFFLIFSYLICRRLFKNVWWVIFGFIILNFASPLIFDFWGLSRGYALGLTFMMMSIYYLLRYIADKRLFFLSLSLVLAILSVYSNFGYINYFLTLCSFIVIRYLLFGKSHTNTSIAKELMIMIIASCLLALLIIPPLISVYGNGELKFMGNSGFIKDTVRSVIYAGLAMIGQSESPTVYIICRTVIILTCLSGIFWAYIYFRKVYRKEFIAIETQYGITFFLLLAGPAITIITQHALLGINYLTDRAALFFIILFMLQITYLLYYLYDKVRIVSIVSFAAIFLLTVSYFCSKMNINTTVLWYFNSADMAVLRKINHESKYKPGMLKVAVSWVSEPSIKYDMDTYYPGRFYPPISISHTPGKDTTYDYYYITVDDVPKLPEGYHRDTDCIGGSFILLRKNEQSLSSAK